LIFVMEKRHGDRLRSKFPESLKGKIVICLQISDNYEYMEPELVEILEAKLSRYLEMSDNEVRVDRSITTPTSPSERNVKLSLHSAPQ
jgi:DNA-binding transcriptional regulator/RsmH inhibitor MraZ